MSTISLKVSDLALKNGFSDGEAISAMIWDLENDPRHAGLEARVEALDDPADASGWPGLTGDQKILAAIAARHLQPLVPDVELSAQGGCHNPVRALTEEGRAVCAASQSRITFGPEGLYEILDALEAEASASPSP